MHLTWEKVARDSKLVYPNDGKAIGIGPIDGQMINVQERDERRDQIVMANKAVQPTGASRSSQTQTQGPRRLAPVADLHVGRQRVA